MHSTDLPFKKRGDRLKASEVNAIVEAVKHFKTIPLGHSDGHATYQGSELPQRPGLRIMNDTGTTLQVGMVVLVSDWAGENYDPYVKVDLENVYANYTKVGYGPYHPARIPIRVACQIQDGTEGWGEFFDSTPVWVRQASTSNAINAIPGQLCGVSKGGVVSHGADLFCIADDTDSAYVWVTAVTSPQNYLCFNPYSSAQGTLGPVFDKTDNNYSGVYVDLQPYAKIPPDYGEPFGLDRECEDSGVTHKLKTLWVANRPLYGYEVCTAISVAGVGMVAIPMHATQYIESQFVVTLLGNPTDGDFELAWGDGANTGLESIAYDFSDISTVMNSTASGTPEFTFLTFGSPPERILITMKVPGAGMPYIYATGNHTFTTGTNPTVLCAMIRQEQKEFISGGVHQQIP